MTDTSSPNGGPLEHMRVLDFTALLQGPLATQMLADLGADVVKIEKPNGEWMRHWGLYDSHTHGETDAFLAFNRNKRSITADLRNGDTVERILELGEHADVVVENFRPGVMDRLGLGFEAFTNRNPRIIYASASGYGTSGPYADRPGQDYLVQALTGAMWLTGRRDDPPFPIGLAVADQVTGLHLVIGILAGLQSRDRTGKGQRVDVDLLSCMLAMQQQELTVFLNHGEPLVRPSENLGHVGITAPAGVYETADGYLMLAMFPCPKLGEIMGLRWLGEYDTNRKMLDGRDEVFRRLSKHFVQRTTSQWIDLLIPHDVWCAPVQAHEQILSDPQIAHKNLIWEVPVGEQGETYLTIGSPFNFSATPPVLTRGAPRVGADTDEFRAGSIWADRSED